MRKYNTSSNYLFGKNGFIDYFRAKLSKNEAIFEPNSKRLKIQFGYDKNRP